MNREERELRQKIDDLKNEAQTLMNNGEHEKAQDKIDEAKGEKAKLDTMMAIQDVNLPEPGNEPAGPQGQDPADPQDDKPTYTQVFSKAIRNKKLTEAEMSVMQEHKAAMTEGTDEDGGLIVPEDITTTINELRRREDALEQYVTVEPVNTNSGARTLEKLTDMTAFADIDEMAEMSEMDSPKFERINYAVKRYAGFLPLSNDLLADTDQNLINYIARWISRKSVFTRNSLILDALDSLSKQELSDYLGIKQTLNVTLDPAISQTAIIVTNQDGYNYLDQQEDDNGRPLLQPDPTRPTQKMLFGKTVVMLSNQTLTSDNSGTDEVKYPFIIGDLKEAIVLFDRRQYSVEMTREGGNAWRTDSTEARAIEREDVRKWDADAVVYGQITESIA